MKVSVRGAVGHVGGPLSCLLGSCGLLFTFIRLFAIAYSSPQAYTIPYAVIRYHTLLFIPEYAVAYFYTFTNI